VALVAFSFMTTLPEAGVGDIIALKTPLSVSVVTFWQSRMFPSWHGLSLRYIMPVTVPFWILS